MKLMNFGSLNLDRKYGVGNFVAPGETKSANSYFENLGGKGLNQSIACARAGSVVWHVGAVGKDGMELLHCLQEEGVDTSHIAVKDTSSGHAVIQVDHAGQNCIIIVSGANGEVGKEQIEEACEALEEGDIALFQNEISNVAYGIAKAKSRGAKVAFNPSPFNEKILEVDLHDVDYLIVNEGEGCEIVGGKLSSPEEILVAIRKNYPWIKTVLTLGEKGCYYMDGEEKYFQDAFSVKAVDTTGAGDTFCGYFLSALLKGCEPERALREAAAAAALAVGKEGAACSIPTRKTVEEFLEKKE